MINLIIELNQGPFINELSNQSEIGHKLICQEIRRVMLVQKSLSGKLIGVIGGAGQREVTSGNTR